MHFSPFCPTMIDGFMFGNNDMKLFPFKLRESIPQIITSNLDNDSDLTVFDNLSQEEKESVYQTVEKELRKTVYDRLRNFKVEFSNKSNVELLRGLNMYILQLNQRWIKIFNLYLNPK